MSDSEYSVIKSDVIKRFDCITYRLSRQCILLNVIEPIKQKYLALKCDYFLIHRLKHVFWVLKRTVSLRRFFLVPTTYVLVERLENSFQLRTLM